MSGAGAYTHMTLLAETTEGMHNLFRLASLASLEGYFRKPRMDRELLAQYAKGIIATTGCPGGEVQTRLRLGQERQAMEAAAAYRDIFGPDNFFVELMDHGLTSSCGTGKRCGRSRGTCRCRTWRPTTCTTRARLTPPRTRPCSACRRARTWPTRAGSSSRAPATT